MQSFEIYIIRWRIRAIKTLRKAVQYAIPSRKSTFRKWSRKILRLSSASVHRQRSNLIQSEAMVLDTSVNFTRRADTLTRYTALYFKYSKQTAVCTVHQFYFCVTTNPYDSKHFYLFVTVTDLSLAPKRTNMTRKKTT